MVTLTSASYHFDSATNQSDTHYTFKVHILQLTQYFSPSDQVKYSRLVLNHPQIVFQ